MQRQPVNSHTKSVSTTPISRVVEIETKFRSAHNNQNFSEYGWFGGMRSMDLTFFCAIQDPRNSISYLLFWHMIPERQRS